MTDMDRLTNKPALHELLAAHFTTPPIAHLVVTRREFSHWMRPDLQKALEAPFARLPGHRFVGARLRDRDLDFRFADLGEAGDGAVADGPAVYQDVDIGEERPVRCLNTRAVARGVRRPALRAAHPNLRLASSPGFPPPLHQL